MTDSIAAEFDRLYRGAGGSQGDPLAALHEVFATYEQARVFAADLQTMFVAERQRAIELSDAIADLEESHRALEMSERRYHTLSSNSSDAVVVVGTSFEALWASAPTQRVWGRSPLELAGTLIENQLQPEDRPRLHAALARALHMPGDNGAITFRIGGGDDTRVIEAVLTSMVADPSVGGVVLNTRDVTERQRLEDRLKFMAYHDALTSLPNRHWFMELLAGAGVLGDPALLNVLVADIDGFKTINDALGHQAGDQALMSTAAAISAVALRHGAFLARLGGDDFGLVLESDSTDAVAALADEIADALGGSADGLDSRGRPTVSVGWAASAAAEAAGVDLMRAAELALDQAKGEGHSRVTAFDAGTMLLWADRFALQADLREVVTRDELVLHYQPIIELQSGTMRGAEALLRWQHPSRGLIPPNTFIPLAEQSGAIIEVGAWALREGCRQLQAWGRAGQPLSPDSFYLSVNVSTVELREPGYVGRVKQVLREHGVHPWRIQLEITESVLAHDPELVIGLMVELKALGVRLAIDDFGTGFSSLGYLATMPVDVMKVDRSFVNGMEDSTRMASVVRATISLAATLGLTVVAEGVETAQQRDTLALLGCELGQGYLYSRPVPAGELPMADELRSSAA